ncbi:exodeoxyribonuclease VII large subunit [Aeromicrobium fastidiosum]|uniref:Exodeoxyribonuclease 7 large subunit n=1 Tax=Aeromicrobium fastidiosum TaxID=52699 RepID=A0A641ALN2_9ACTN|nr:exodeoxyribonuclease VII large subunit [Aeromicrobium fastidiosum]KAA1378200.1 exodeoxyribonuclease VII large subunit [Aeromicrobium fastidiosum]MBP2388991.1 exodeoxyribonuclease VII large subunit [Aeromicrobium fastidiosum]
MALDTSADTPAPLRQISQLLDGYIGRLGAVWVEAEIAQLTRRQGICFLTLRDLQAKISIDAKCHVSVLDASPVPVTEGSRVVVHAKPAFYAPRGSLSLDLREIRPQGEGELLAQLERRRQLLAAEGLFDPRLKKPLPLLPRGIGLITGRASAAERDILENARLRWPDVHFVVRHALMQGNDSARDVMAALRQLSDDPSIDVIVIARGGGSVEDLLPFSDEALIRAVHACPVPVVSAIGHEPDTPILDLVADLRASTPTDAAKRIVPDVREELAGVAMMRERASVAIRSILEREVRGLADIRSRPVLAQPSTLVDAEQSLVHDWRDRSRRSLGHRLDRAGDEVGHHLARVRALSPLATLERGYGVAQLPDGTVVTSIAQVSPDAELTIRVVDGSIAVRTLTTHPTPTGEDPHG